MDNKKWYKKFATIFWWTISILPILVIILVMIGAILNIKEQNLNTTDLTTYMNDTIYNNVFYSNCFTLFENISISYLTTMFSNLANIIGVSHNTIIGIILGYMLSIAVYHLLFDLLVFFIHLIHEYCEPERWCK